MGEHAAKSIDTIAAAGKVMATRKASQAALEAFAPVLPELVGGSADLTGSNNTLHKYSKPLTAGDAGGNYLFYGVREFGMAAIMNGQAAHGGVIPYGGTFLVFSDYARNALRMAALIGLRSIFVLTHDSIGLGEDGPTHQPIEHLASLRLMPNMDVWRPCDTVETAVAWRAAIEKANGPTCLVLTRQDLPHVPRTPEQIEAVARGGYIVSNGNEPPAVTLIATGSEVQLAVGAARELEKSGVAVRVVSMPCTQAFDRQPSEYRRSRSTADRRTARHRSRRDGRLVALRRRARRRDRPRSLRPLGARETVVRALRLHRRSRRRGREAAALIQPRPACQREASCPSKLQSTVMAASAATFCARSTNRSVRAKYKSSPSTISATPRPTRI